MNKPLIDICQKKINKEIDKTWDELADEYGFINGEFLRQKFKKWRKKNGVLPVKNIIIDKNIENKLNEIDLKKIELQKEKQKFYDHRKEYNRIVRDNARWDELKNIIIKTIDNIRPYDREINYDIKKSDNDLIVGLNDIHYGIVINNYWNKYDSDIAKKRLEKYLIEIINIQKVHNSENCYIFANGDFISGNIHLTVALSNKENIIQQIMGVSELISWFISELSKYFKRVYFSSVAGNHSRLALKDQSPKDERLDDLIPFYIKARLQNFSNVEVIDNEIDNTMSLINIRGKNYLGVHGDFDKVNNILKAVGMIPHKVYAIFMGHLHHNRLDNIQGYKILMSGSVMGVDDFCVEKRILGKPQQLVCICEENGVRCVYDVDLD